MLVPTAVSRLLTIVVALTLAGAVLAGTGAAATLDADSTTGAQDTLERGESTPDGEALSFHDGGNGSNDSGGTDSSDDENYNENNVGVVNVEDQLVVDLGRGHVGNGSDHPTTDENAGANAENYNENNVVVVHTQDNYLVKE